MADIQPLRTLRYEPRVVGSFDAVTAPPYDVIDDAERAALAAKSPFNVVEVDLPRDENGGDPYLRAQSTFEAWQQQGVVVREREPAIWTLTQDYTGPDGRQRTRHGFLCRVRVEDYGPGRIRPHERTHPGPKEDRLRLTRATRTNLSPIFSLFDDPEQHVKMNGREVFKFATRVLVSSGEAVLGRGGLGIDDVDVYVPHQANVRIIDHATKKLGIPSERVVINVDRYGNTSSGSIPLALAEAQVDGRLQAGNVVLMTGMGAGLTWGSALMRWTA